METSQILDKKNCIKAITNYDMYSLSQKAILIAFVQLSIDDLVSVSADYICQITKLSNQCVYQSIAKLVKDKAITTIKQKGTRVNTYMLQKPKLDYIIQTYKNKLIVKNLEF